MCTSLGLLASLAHKAQTKYSSGDAPISTSQICTFVQHGNFKIQCCCLTLNTLKTFHKVYKNTLPEYNAILLWNATYNLQII